LLPGGDAAARFPVQCAAGYLHDMAELPDLLAPPFSFSTRYEWARRILEAGVRTFASSSVGRLFDTIAALLGFTGEISFEGQAAIWVEQLARKSSFKRAYDFPASQGVLDFRPVLSEIINDRRRGRVIEDIARGFHLSLAEALQTTVRELCESKSIDLIVLSGGVFQNDLLLKDVQRALQRLGVEVWVNSIVPPNDGGISLGQGASASLTNPDT
jgi:hydrogenase maturation protein HypF